MRMSVSRPHGNRTPGRSIGRALHRSFVGAGLAVSLLVLPGSGAPSATAFPRR